MSRLKRLYVSAASGGARVTWPNTRPRPVACIRDTHHPRSGHNSENLRGGQSVRTPPSAQLRATRLDMKDENLHRPRRSLHHHHRHSSSSLLAAVTTPRARRTDVGSHAALQILTGNFQRDSNFEAALRHADAPARHSRWRVRCFAHACECGCGRAVAVGMASGARTAATITVRFRTAPNRCVGGFARRRGRPRCGVAVA